MPADFDRCMTTKGHKVRTKKLKGNKYAHICIMPNGKTMMGEIKTAKKK